MSTPVLAIVPEVLAHNVIPHLLQDAHNMHAVRLRLMSRVSGRVELLLFRPARHANNCVSSPKINPTNHNFVLSVDSE